MREWLGNTGKKIEVKSWIKMYKPTFITQFIKKDLRNAESLDKVQWICDKKYEKGGKILKNDIIETLKSPQGRQALNQSHILSLFDDYANKINYNSDISTIDQLISFMENNNSWFDLIFKIQ